MPYAWREVPPRPSPYPRRRAAPSARAVTNTAAALALASGLLAFFAWPVVLGLAAMACGSAGWYAAEDDAGAGGLLAAAGVVTGLLAIFATI